MCGSCGTLLFGHKIQNVRFSEHQRELLETKSKQFESVQTTMKSIVRDILLGGIMSYNQAVACFKVDKLFQHIEVKSRLEAVRIGRRKSAEN